MKRKLAFIAMAAVVAALVIPSGALSARVLPAGAKPGGDTYTQWAVSWLSEGLRRSPASENALLTLNGGKCGFARGKMWFLPDVFRVAFLRSTCDIPRGMTIFVPVAWYIDTATKKHLGQRRGIRGAFTEASLTVDGHDLGSGRWIASPVFSVDLPLRNAFGVPPGTWNFFTNGYFAILAPLAPGRHVVATRATFAGFTGGYTFNLNIL